MRHCPHCPSVIDDDRTGPTCGAGACRVAEHRARRGRPRRRLRSATVVQRAAEVLTEAVEVEGHRIARRLGPAGAPLPERVDIEGGRRLAQVPALVLAAERGDEDLRPARPVCGRLDCIEPEHLEHLTR